MSNRLTWLSQEIERWTADAIITREQADRLHQRYATTAAAMPWGMIVFFGIGAVVIGLGIILLFAYNWQAIPKAGKLSLVFGALAVAHGAALWLLLKDDWRRHLGEAFALLGTMFFGAGIWLIAQIYHINEHFPQGFLIWGLGALTLAWALPSVVQGLLAVILLTIWGCTERFEFEAPADATALLLIAGVAPLVWRQRSPLLLGALLAALFVWLPLHASYRAAGSGAFLTAFALSVLLLALQQLLKSRTSIETLTKVLGFFGQSGFLVCVFLLGFHDAADDLLGPERTGAETSLIFEVYHWSVVGAALVGWLIVAARARRSHTSERPPLEATLYPLSLLVAVVAGLDASGTAPGVALICNLVILSVATAWIVRGVRQARLRLIVLGSLLVGVTVFARYFDLFDSLAARGLAFVAFGGLLFAEGFFYRRQRLER